MVRSLVCLLAFGLIGLLPLPLQAAAAPSAPPIKVEYRISRVHGLLEFAFALAETGVSAPGLREVWVRSNYQTPEIKAAVADLISISRSLQNGWDFNSPVASRPEGGAIDMVLVTQSLYARDLTDFATRTLELLPMSDHRILLRSLKTLEPVYRDLVWSKSERELVMTKTALERLAAKSNLNTMFSKAVHFYRGNWPVDVPFVVGLYAIPFLKDFNNSTASTSFSSVEVHGVQTGVKQGNLESDFGVVFHELCHSIYKSQSDETKANLETWFLEDKSPYARLAYLYLNEGLATAFGNGWAYREVRGKLDETRWYNQATIDAYGKLLYPLVLEYLKETRAIDREFVHRAIQGFGEKMPDSINRFENLLNKLIAVHNGSMLKNGDLRDLRKAYRSSSFSGGAPLLAQETIDDVNKSSGAVVLVLGPKDQVDFDQFASRIPFIGSRAKDIRKMPKRSYYASNSVEGRLLLVIKATSHDDLTAAIDSMKKREALTPGQFVYEY